MCWIVHRPHLSLSAHPPFPPSHLVPPPPPPPLHLSLPPALPLPIHLAISPSTHRPTPRQRALSLLHPPPSRSRRQPRRSTWSPLQLAGHRLRSLAASSSSCRSQCMCAATIEMAEWQAAMSELFDKSTNAIGLLMKMASGDDFPLWQDAGTGFRLSFRGYRGLRRRNFSYRVLFGGLGIYRNFWH